MKPLVLGLAMIVLGLGTGSASAQVRWYRPYGSGGEYYAGGLLARGRAQRGMADVIRSRGEAAESYSHAAINREIARSKYLDNKLKWTDIYWKRKRLGEAELAKDYDKMCARRDAYLAATRDRPPEVLRPASWISRRGKSNGPMPFRDRTMPNSASKSRRNSSFKQAPPPCRTRARFGFTPGKCRASSKTTSGRWTRTSISRAASFWIGS